MISPLCDAVREQAASSQQHEPTHSRDEETWPQHQQNNTRAADSGEPSSSSTRFKAAESASAGTAAANGATSTAQQHPGGEQPSAGAAGGSGSTAHQCGRAGWCLKPQPQQSGATSHSRMPPADPSRPGSHVVVDTSLMLQEQQPQEQLTASLAVAALASPRAGGAVPAAAAAPPSPHAEAAPAAAQGDDKQPSKQRRITPAAVVAAAAGTTDSDDDSWSPGQPHSSAGDADNGGAAATASVDGSDEDMMAAAAYESDEGMEDDEDDDGWAQEGMPPPVYCTNCTARMYVSSDVCSDCGHSKEQDSELLTCTAASADSSDATAAAGDCPIIIWDESMLLHEEGKLEPHPERPDRLRAVMAQLNSNGLTGLCQRVPARLATKEELLRVHTPDHLHRLQLFCSGQVPPSAIPSDTYINQHTLQCAALAAGSAAEVAVRVYQGEGPCGAAIIRPPGHHAESNTAMGFCFFNNAACAARAVQAAGAQRVLILDWDVHHGNGTQHIFEQDDSVLYMSLHRYDRGTFYPGTGAASEVGQGVGEGFTVNVPWDTDGVSDGDYMAAMEQVLLPVAREFAPDVVLISAGFDAAAGDPIGGCNLTPECFAAMTAALMPIAPTVLLLEGGYNLRSTALSTEACLRVLLGEPAPVAISATPSPYAWFSIQAARKAHSKYWDCLAGSSQPPLHLPGWRMAATNHQQQHQAQQQQESDGLELQYEDEYEEAEYESDGQEGEEDDDDDADAGVVLSEDGDAAAAARQRQAGAVRSRPGKRRVESRGDDDAAAGAVDDVDAGGAGRRVRSAAGAAGVSGRPPYLQRSGVPHHVGSSSSAARPLARHGSGASSSNAAAASSSHNCYNTAAGSGSGNSRHFAGRIGLSRKQQMLQAIHKRAMQFFLRKQRKVAAARRQQEQQQQQQQYTGL